MSHYKDSSVARSRLKRPHRIPARFEDFSTLPTTHHISSPELERSVSPPPELKPQSTVKLSTVEKVIKEKSASTSSSIDVEPTTNALNNSASKTPPPPPPPLLSKEQKFSIINKEVTIEELKSISKLVDGTLSERLEEEEEEEKSKEKRNKNKDPPLNDNGNSTKSNIRKKARGFSLMVKKNPNSVLFQPKTANVNNNIPTTNYGNGDINNRVNPQQLLIQQQQQQQQQQQTAKYYTSNLPQCMQYGTRLMINEPIYLPRNVATIAPITTTLQQMEEQVRKLPYLSEKAKQCKAYQDKQKMNWMISNYDALVKITEHLEVCDLLNLRLVNKSWKSIIDSDMVWKTVRIEKTNVKNCDELGRVLVRRKTTDLYMKQLNLKVSWYRVFENLIREDIDLKRIFIESSDDSLNRHVVELLCVLNFNYKRVDKLKVHWKVKSHVDDAGLVLIPFKMRRQMTILPDPKMNLYCYKTYPNWLSEDKNGIIMLEISDIIDLFNGGVGDRSDMPASYKPEITIEPV